MTFEFFLNPLGIGPSNQAGLLPFTCKQMQTTNKTQLSVQSPESSLRPNGVRYAKGSLFKFFFDIEQPYVPLALERVIICAFLCYCLVKLIILRCNAMSLSPTGLYWALWAQLDFTGLNWAVLGCTGLYLAVMGSTGRYWVVLGCIGLGWAALDCLGPYWMVLGSSRLYRAVVRCSGLSIERLLTLKRL